MATVSLIDPYSQQAEEIARRQRMAQALQESGSQVLQMPTTPGVAISPLAGLAKVLESGLGAYQEKKARQDYAKLQNEYRTNYDKQFGDLARAISAPAQEAFAGQEAVPGQEAIPAKPAVMAPQIEKSFGGYGMPREVGQYEVSPAVAGKEAVPGQPAIPARPALPAGYISPETLQGIDIPEVKQLAMARYLAQFEPKDVKLGAGDVLYRQQGPNGQLAPVATAAPTPQRPIALSPGQELRGPTGNLLATAAAKSESTTPHWEATTQNVDGKPVAGWINLNATDKAASFVAGAKPAEAKAATPHWVEGQKDVNGTTQFGWYDLNSADKDASFKAGAKPPVGEKSNWKEVTRGNQVFYEDFNIADPTKRQAAAIAKEAVKTSPHYNEIEQGGNVVIVDMSLPPSERLANAQIKGPIRNNLEKITTTDASGREVSRYVDKGTLATLGDIPAPYKGFMSDLAEAGQLPANWQNIPQIAGLVRENLINKAGGITPKDLANLKVRIAEAASRLAYEGVPGFNPKDLTPALSNFTTLSGGAPASAPTATLKITTRAEIADAAKRAGKSIEEVTRDAITKGYKVQ